MPTKRLPMRNILEVLRLHELKFSSRQIAQAVKIARSTVGDYLRRAKVCKLTHQEASKLDEQALEQQLFPPAPPSNQARPMPDWSQVHKELGRAHVTLSLLWREYKLEHPTGLQYSAFCDHYRQWSGKLNVTMRQIHIPGDKMFVDYAGATLEVIDSNTGEIRKAQLFVATLGASNYTFAEATWSQGIADWIGSHVRALNFFGGCPRSVVPDNLKSAVIKAHPFDPTINESYAEWARHYDIAILPTRVRKPKDKAKVEAAVLLAERWIVAALRNTKFFSLHELNQAIGELLEKLNTHPFKKMKGSRLTAFEELDKPALKSLPTEAYEFADWKKARVGIDYHVEVFKRYYSVPYQYAKQEVMVRIRERTIEVFAKGKRIASHVRQSGYPLHSTLAEHMPTNHRALADWTPAKFRVQAQEIGPSTLAVVERRLNSRQHPEQAYRSCMGILRLAKIYGKEQLEGACQLSIQINSPNYRSINSILRTGKAKSSEQREKAPQALLPIEHENVRGAHYYH